MAPDPRPKAGDESPIRCQGETINEIHTSDESEDNEEANRHEGYEPLNMNENLVNETDNCVMDTEEDTQNNPTPAPVQQSPFTANLDMMDEIQDLNVGCKGDEEPISVEAEVMAEVWNKPRPETLNFELDVNSQELIKSVMSSIQLPQLKAPQWAEGLSDTDLKETVLQKVRKRSNQVKIGSTSKSKQD